MKWTNSYRSFGLKTKRSTGLKTIEHKHETALTLISPIEYQLAESAYDGEAYSMAVELGVTMQVLKDYQTLLEQRIRYGAEMVGQQP